MTWRAWWSRLRGSLRRDDALEREMNREMEFHVEMATRRNVQRGMEPQVARRHAKLAFGSTEAFKEEARDTHRARAAENVVLDIRYAFRSLGRSPTFTIAAVLTLAIGIGASTAMFTVVNGVLLRPLPIPDPQNFTYVGWVWSKGGDIPALTPLQYEFVRDNNRAFEAVATYRSMEAHVGDESTAQPLRGLRVSDGFFRTIGFTPRLGRTFDARELETEGATVVILGDDVWRTRFQAQPNIVGQEIRLDGEPHTVIGVLPPEFRFPPAINNTAYLVPLVVRVDPRDEGHNTAVIARLRHGTSQSEQDAEMRALSDAFRNAYPEFAPDTDAFRLYTHGDVHVGSAARHTLWVLFGTVSLVLLIACANTAMLLLVRASTRQREIAVRASLGAGRARIIQQLLTEGLVLSLSAATLGVLFSVVGLRAFLIAAPTALPVGTDLGLDVRVLAWAVGVSVATGVIFGFAAAGPAYRVHLQSLLGGTRGVAGGGKRARYALVFLETTVAVVLLAGATLLTTSFARLISVDPGFDADQVTVARLGRLPAEYDALGRNQLVHRLLERVRGLPGVVSAAAAPNLPLERGLNFPVDIAEHPELAIGAVELRVVSPDYLATLGIPLRAGRDFNERDIAGTEPVAIVNETLARHFWDDASPLDRTIQVGHFRDRWLAPGLQHQTRVIGVAADIREMGLDRNSRPTVLLPRAQAGADGTPLLLVRATAPGLLNALREAVVLEEPQLAPRIEPLSNVVSRSVAEPRFRTLLVSLFAAFALLLAGVGIYGVIASVVQQSRREIGIRIALGANRAAVAAAVLRRCLTYVMAGTLTGLLAFWAARHILSSWLYDITPGDPRVLTISVLVLAFVATVASWIPARRATRIDPVTSLRLE